MVDTLIVRHLNDESSSNDEIFFDSSSGEADG